MNNKRKYPILRGRIVNERLLFVHCPWCDREHLHGYDPLDKMRSQHRAAHCDPESPFHEHGYLIAPFRKKDLCHHQTSADLAAHQPSCLTT
jgi:hypothetical protein